MKMKFQVILEKGKTGYAAKAPDLPGCMAVGRTAEEALKLIREAIEMRVRDLRDRGEWPPKH